ncbi:MAG: hypothetical protein HQ522_06215 [Bacteroidetes bacterium]|nr:hypothetical protein [Bacteroidota bacterium]
MSKFLRYAIFIIPIIFSWVGSTIELAKFGNDPNYVYLVNATALCDGESVGYIDHPGTTVMQISAVTIAVKHFFSNPENDTLVNHVFKDPHTFILAIRSVFLIINTMILFLLGWIAIKTTRSIWAALLLQASCFLTVNSLDHVWTKVSPAPILFFITCVYVIAILYFYADNNKKQWKYGFTFSLIVGAGIVTKATFIPLAILPFVIIPTLKRKFFYGLGIIPSFVLFSIPIIPEYENMYFWFRNLSSHSGIYGHGSKGFIDFQTYIPNIGKIIINNPVFALVFIIGLVIVSISILQYLLKKKPIEINTQILMGLVATSGFGILLVAKHYHSNHYLIPVLLLTGISTFFILNQLLKAKIPVLIKKSIWPVLVVILIVGLSFLQPAKIKYFKDGYKITNQEMDSTYAMIDRDFTDYTQIYYYPNTLNQYSALNFGNVYSKQKMLPYLKEIYNDTYFYHTGTNTIQNWTNDVFLEDIVEKHGNKILLIGGPRNKEVAQKISDDGFPLINIYKGRLQAIYKLDTVRFNRLQNGGQASLQYNLSCDIETISNQGSHFITSNGEEFGNANCRSNEKARSGKYSVKMDEKMLFVMEYRLNNLKEGDLYEVTIWRHSEDNSGLLVVSSDDARLFYKAQSVALKTDENGWQLLRTKFTITSNLQGKSLKIYLWNKDKKQVYFDDLSIQKSTPTLN